MVQRRSQYILALTAYCVTTVGTTCNMRCAILTPLVVLAILLRPSIASSIEVTQETIAQYIKGIEELQNSFDPSPPIPQPYDPLQYNEHAAFHNAEVYDFIIVGAGAAGSVIANRLSEIPTWKILLLESGGYETPYTQIPGMAGAVLGSKYDWRYITEPQTTWCLGMIDRRCTTSAGKGVGGGTIINGMVYTRGNPGDYDLWANQGNPGWSYADVLPYFKKAENCALRECDAKYHSRGGPLYVEETQNASPLLSTFLSAGKELGYQVIDYNGKQQIGFSKSQSTTKRGVRNSAARSYLVPLGNRKNLHVKHLSHVTQLMIRPLSKTVTGVKYMHNNVLCIAKTIKEVIVTAGPFNSAQLLMLSGIGPRDDLGKLNIPVINDLQVGRNLKGHVAFQGLNFILNISKFEEPTLSEQIATWLKHGKGPLASIAGTGLAFIQTEMRKNNTAYPDIEILLGRAMFSDRLRINEKYKYLLEPKSEYETLRIDIMPTHPESTGTLKLGSRNPYEMPVINPSQFSDPNGNDIETVLRGIKKVFELIKTNAFQKLGAYLFPEAIKECEQFGFATDNYWKCAILYFSIDVRHRTGTCKMGPRGDIYAVVDNNLRVHGIHKLRVADSSVVPVTISGHTHAASNMVGEKAADLIKQQWL